METIEQCWVELVLNNLGVFWIVCQNLKNTIKSMYITEELNPCTQTHSIKFNFSFNNISKYHCSNLQDHGNDYSYKETFYHVTSKPKYTGDIAIITMKPF